MALLLTIPLLAAAREPAHAAARGSVGTVDPYARYDGQVNCTSQAGPGTQALARWLQSRYPRTGSLGMMRACSSGGSSEHKDGRAFDWRADVANPGTRADAYHFINKILATDGNGNAHALARRMGVMYVIYDDKLWASYRDFEPRAYVHPACKQAEGCSRTLRHHDHVHISLSRAGAAGQSSWYRSSNVSRDIVHYPGTNLLDPDNTAITKPIVVPANGKLVRAPFRLKGGVTYRIVATGMARYAGGPNTGDASCHWDKAEGKFVPTPRGKMHYPDDSGGSWGSNTSADTPYATAQKTSHGLKVNNRMRWDRPNLCRPDHTYETWVTPERDEDLRLQYADIPANGNLGKFLVYVARDDILRQSMRQPVDPGKNKEPVARRGGKVTGPRLVREHVWVDTSRYIGGVSQGQIVKGKRYWVRITGEAKDGAFPFDSQCVKFGGWRRQHSTNPDRPADDHLDVYLNGMKLDLSPRGGKKGTCAADHVYQGAFTALSSGKALLRVWDPYTHANNRGKFRVTLVAY